MTKDERIAELENEIKKKDELIKQLGEANKFLSSDKAVSTEQVKQIAREIQIKVMKENIKIIYSNLRHEICEKVRLYCRDKFEPASNKLGCIVEINREEFFEFLDQIERGED